MKAKIIDSQTLTPRMEKRKKMENEILENTDLFGEFLNLHIYILQLMLQDMEG